MILHKKGALNLSINAIVVLIIAIVFLGLALTFTRNIINQSTDKLKTGIDNVDLSIPADADNRITVDGAFEVKKNGKKTIKIGYYNSGSSWVYDKPEITKCVNDTGGTVGNATIAAVKSNVSANEETRYQISFTAGGLDVGNYICNLNINNTNLQVPVTITS